MVDLAEALRRLAYPAVLIAFLALYVLGVVSGVAAETALLRAGIAALALATLARVAGALLEAATPKGSSAQPSEPRTARSAADEAIALPATSTSAPASAGDTDNTGPAPAA